VHTDFQLTWQFVWCPFLIMFNYFSLRLLKCSPCRSLLFNHVQPNNIKQRNDMWASRLLVQWDRHQRLGLSHAWICPFRFDQCWSYLGFVNRCRVIGYSIVTVDVLQPIRIFADLALEEIWIHIDPPLHQLSTWGTVSQIFILFHCLRRLFAKTWLRVGAVRTPAFKWKPAETLPRH